MVSSLGTTRRVLPAFREASTPGLVTADNGLVTANKRTFEGYQSYPCSHSKCFVIVISTYHYRLLENRTFVTCEFTKCNVKRKLRLIIISHSFQWFYCGLRQLRRVTTKNTVGSQDRGAWCADILHYLFIYTYIKERYH